MYTILRFALIAIVMIIIGLLSVWGTLALWFRLPGPGWSGALLAAGFALLGAATMLAQLSRARLRFLAVFGLVFVVVSLWWNTLTPPLHADWTPDVAHQVTGTIDGDQLTLTNLRNFKWRTPEEYTPLWETRSYDLNKLQTADLTMSYWSGPGIAHMIVSFGFEDGQYLAWSAEVRREVGNTYSPLNDMFKQHTLVLIAADERDVIGTRTNARGEDVQMYRIDTTPEAARALLTDYVKLSNELAIQPRWYNSITYNCTTVVIAMIRNLFQTVPLDWRIFVNGYLPEYAYDIGALDSRLSFDEVQARAHITEVARRAGITPTFSSDIRANLPDPHK